MYSTMYAKGNRCLTYASKIQDLDATTGSRSVLQNMSTKQETIVNDLENYIFVSLALAKENLSLSKKIHFPENTDKSSLQSQGVIEQLSVVENSWYILGHDTSYTEGKVCA